jgi:hypothetical protein
MNIFPFPLSIHPTPPPLVIGLLHVPTLIYALLGKSLVAFFVLQEQNLLSIFSECQCFGIFHQIINFTSGYLKRKDISPNLLLFFG